MLTVETLHDIIGDKQITFDFKFHHVGIVDANYAKLFIMMVNTGIIKIDAKLTDLPQQPTLPLQEELINPNNTNMGNEVQTPVAEEPQAEAPAEATPEATPAEVPAEPAAAPAADAPAEATA